MKADVPHDALALESMNYKSFADLARDIGSHLDRVPRDIELIAGVPRSGLMAASIMALQLNLKFCDLGSFLRNAPLDSGDFRQPTANLLNAFDAAKVLVLDDSIASGEAMRKAKALVHASAYRGRVLYGAVYGIPGQTEADLVLEELATPRFFEWNLFHRPELEHCCVDVDGVLCVDPHPDVNDDGDRYLEFLVSATPLARPTYKIGHVVTSRLEKYRPQTERWLETHGIRFGQLHMLNLPSAAERLKYGHASFKASVYARIAGAMLFIESDSAQAADIARLSGKPVLDFSRQVLVRPGLTISSVAAEGRALSQRVRMRFRDLLG